MFYDFISPQTIFDQSTERGIFVSMRTRGAIFRDRGCVLFSGYTRLFGRHCLVDLSKQPHAKGDQLKVSAPAIDQRSCCNAVGIQSR